MEKNPNRRIYGNVRETSSERTASTPASSSVSLTSALACSSPLAGSMLSRSISPDLLPDRHRYPSQFPFASAFVSNKINGEDGSVVRSPNVGSVLPELYTRDCVFFVNEYGRDQETKSNGASWIPEGDWSVCRDVPLDVAGRKMSGGERVDAVSPELTLEAFLDSLDVDNSMVNQQPQSPQQQQQQQRQVTNMEKSFDYFNGGVDVSGKGVGSMSGRGRKSKREPDEQDILSQKREKRMVRNRESAAKSREKKQIYTFSLENKLYKLEVENSTLKQGHESQEEWSKKRLKELKIIRPTVVERKRLQSQPRQQFHLKRSHSL